MRGGAPRRLFTDMEMETMEAPSPVMAANTVSRVLDGGVRGMEACLQRRQDCRVRDTQGARDRRREAREEAIAYVPLPLPLNLTFFFSSHLLKARLPKPSLLFIWGGQNIYSSTL